MYLVKCPCGCHFTFKTLKADQRIRCQECGKGVTFFPLDDSADAISKLESGGFNVSRIPEDARITVTFQV